MKRKMYVLKITLNEIEPVIWRRFAVSGDISLDRLHDVIQIIMGWLDYHLHEFFIDGDCYTENPESLEDGKQEGKFRLCDLVKRKGTKFEYLYDFGDNWEHHLVLEKTNYVVEGHEAKIICMDGERTCPPEDVGGITGYIDFCEAILDDKHPRYAEFKEWYLDSNVSDGQFDREYFDPEKVNLELLRYQRWSRPQLIS